MNIFERKTRSFGGIPLPRLFFVLLCFLFLIAQASWLAQNETILGNDAGAHLVRSLEVYEALQQPSREALATIWEVSEHRPPFSYVLTAPFYGLFGLSYDVALWSNGFWLLLTARVVYLFASRLGDEWDGLWSVLLTLTMPLLFELTRLYYQEPLVTFVLWWGLLALLLSNGFAKRGWSIHFGFVIGLGLLIKWTLPTYLAGPLLLLTWLHRREWRLEAVARKHSYSSLAVGAFLAAACLWLVALMVPQLSYRLLFWLVWTGLFGLIGIGVSGEPSQTKNALSAGSLALLIGTLWYFPRSGFIDTFSAFAFSDAGRPEQVGSYSLFHPATWLFYLRAIAWEQVGLLAFLLFVFALMILFRHWRRNQLGMQILLTALLGSWLILTLSPFRDHARGFVPMLPAMAMVTVLAVRQVPRWGGVLLGLVLTWQVLQFGLLTFQAGEAMARPLQAWHLITKGGYHYWPNSGISNSAYHVAPRVLESLLTARGERQRISLATLINETQLHPNTLRAEFEMMASDAVRVIPLSKDVEEPFAALFNVPFVLYKSGMANDVTPQAQEAINRMTGEKEGIFDAAFETVWEQSTPTGDTIILAQRRYALIPNSVQEIYRPLIEQLQPLLTSNDIGLIDTKAQINPLGAFGWPETPILVAPDFADERWLPAIESLSPGQRIFAILWNEKPTTHAWLNEHFVRGQDWWFGDIHLIAYVLTMSEPALIFSDLGTLNTTSLQQLTIDQDALQPGGSVVISLEFQSAENELTTYRTVLELYGADGSLIAKRDLPQESDAPWQVGTNRQKTVLLLPTQLPPLPACLIIARYDPNTGERLLTPEGEDHITLCAWPKNKK